MKRTSDTRRTAFDGERGVTEVLGVALLVGIVVLGATAIVLVGGNAIEDDESEIETAQAEHAMVQFDSKASQVGLGATDSERVDMGLRGNDGALEVDDEAGWMQIEYRDDRTGERTEAVNESLGALVYEHEETTIAYQGGGVWRSDGDGSVMTSRPEFHFQEKTLSMPIVRTTSDGHVHSDLTISGDGAGTEHFPNESATMTNRVEDATIVITIQSDYYDAWARYFETETGSVVEMDHERERTTVTLLAHPPELEPRGGVIATSGTGEVDMKATDAYIDSYNSSEGAYEATRSSNATLEAVGNVTMGGNAAVAGDVRSGGIVEIDSSSNEVEGTVYWTDDYDPHKNADVSDDERIDGVRAVPSVDDHVEAVVDRLRKENDNEAAADVIDGGGPTIDGSGELDPGGYYVDHISLEGEELVVNATDGDVTIAVNNWVNVTDGGEITIEGDGDVELYVASEETFEPKTTGLGIGEQNFYVGKGSSIHDPSKPSSQLKLFAPGHFDGAVGSDAADTPEVTGMIYAPASFHGDGSFHIMQGDVYGMVVTGSMSLDNQGQIHFDEGLRDEPLPLAPEKSKLEFLYASTHEIEVSGG